MDHATNLDNTQPGTVYFQRFRVATSAMFIGTDGLLSFKFSIARRLSARGGAREVAITHKQISLSSYRAEETARVKKKVRTLRIEIEIRQWNRIAGELSPFPNQWSNGASDNAASKRPAYLIVAWSFINSFRECERHRVVCLQPVPFEEERSCCIARRKYRSRSNR